jgi:Protein of unknown function (DUF2809)
VIQKTYALLTLVLFGIEVAIALYVHDTLIRPYIGDLLVVILLYCFLKSFIQIGVTKAGVGVLLFACSVETMQYFNLVDHLGLSHNRLAKIVIGSSFSWADIVCYTIGILLVVLVEHYFQKKQLQ